MDIAKLSDPEMMRNLRERVNKAPNPYPTCTPSIPPDPDPMPPNSVPPSDIEKTNELTQCPQTTPSHTLLIPLTLRSAFMSELTPPSSEHG